MHEKHKANQNLQRKKRNKEKKKTKKKINYKRGENKGTKRENHYMWVSKYETSQIEIN